MVISKIMTNFAFDMSICQGNLHELIAALVGFLTSRKLEGW